MNKKLLLLLPVFVLLVGCSEKENTVTSSTNGTESDISETSESESLESESQEDLETAHKVVTFKGSKDRSNMNSGAQLSNAGPKNATIALFNTDEEILEDLEASKVAYQRVGGDGTGITSLTIGSGSDGGDLKLFFKVEIVEIKVVIQAYYNVYNGGMSVDTNAKVTIEDNEYDLSSDGTAVPEEYEKTITLNKVKTLEFSNDGEKQRTYIHELDITYVAK